MVHERRAGAMKGFLNKLQERFERGVEEVEAEADDVILKVKSKKRQIEAPPRAPIYVLEKQLEHTDETAHVPIPKKAKERPVPKKSLVKKPVRSKHDIQLLNSKP